MHLEHSSAMKLKTWMVHRLEPVCDADPAVLSDYVIALLRHNKPEDELKLTCLKQLDDFLSKETNQFVIDLFEQLTTSSKFNGALKSSENNSPTTVSLGKRPLSDDLSYSPSNSPSSNAFVDPSYRPHSTSLIPQYTPTQSHPNFLHFPENQPQNFEIPRSTLAGLPSQLYDSNAQQSKNAKRPRKSEICRDYHFRGYCSRGDDCVYSHDDKNSTATNQTYVPAYNPTQPNGNISSLSSPPQSSLPHSNTSQVFNGNLSAPITSLPFSNEFLASILSVNSFLPSAAPSAPISSKPIEPAQRYNRSPLKKSQTTLVVENIPQSCLSERSVYEFFSAFGPLVGASVEFNTSQALVEFESAEDAKRAYSSPEPVFNNRFVKIHFKRLGPHEFQSGEERTNGKIRAPLNGSSTQSGEPSGWRSSNDHSISNLPRPGAGQMSLNNLRSQLKPAQYTRSSDVLSEREKELRIKIDVQKRLLEQLSSKKSLNLSDGSLPLVKKEEGSDNSTAKVEKSENKNDIISLENGGKDNVGDSKKDDEKPRIDESISMPSKPISGNLPKAASPANSFTRRLVATPRTSLVNTRTTWSSHATSTKSFKLDNRSSSLAIRQIPSFSAREAIRDYLTQFGTIISTAPLREDDKVPDFSVKFSTRAAAEKALNQGNEIPDVGQVSMSWATTNLPASSTSNSNFTTSLSAIPGLKSSIFSSEPFTTSFSSSGKRISHDEGLEENGEADGWKR
ncbi:hypothetical protein BY996DRAFT_4573478 [Phakopsora pachyrhizi]|nr:hypothetical protein BY996DRAFT_4573478 [Phakopsora pachyrhizi]